MKTLLLSDLHLDPSRPDITALFLELLRGEARGARALYVLGDLFEAWVGDDEDSGLAHAVRAGLRELVCAGVPVSILRGNRDFLLGPGFARDTGAVLLPDPCVATLGGEPTLLLHGDLLCTDDLPYLAVRRQVRDSIWQQTFLAQPIAVRRDFAARARQQSQTAQQAQALEVGDAVPAAAEAMLQLYGVRRMIHGHTHRPRVHLHEVDGRTCERIVLGDWYSQGSLLRIADDGTAGLEALPLRDSSAAAAAGTA